jgi:hypothetical protein
MKTNQFLLSVLSVLTLISCNAYKEKLKVNGYESEAIHNAILDFSNTSPIFKTDSIFSISVYNSLDDKKYLVRVGRNSTKILVNDSIKSLVGLKVKTIPTRFKEFKNKIFIWMDDDYPLTQEALDIYKKYNLLQDDEGGWVLFPDSSVNESQKGVHYYFCKNNLTIYKKVTTNIGLGYYDPPVFNCN